MACTEELSRRSKIKRTLSNWNSKKRKLRLAWEVGESFNGLHEYFLVNIMRGYFHIFQKQGLVKYIVSPFCLGIEKTNYMIIWSWELSGITFKLYNEGVHHHVGNDATEESNAFRTIFNTLKWHIIQKHGITVHNREIIINYRKSSVSCQVCYVQLEMAVSWLK